MAPTATGCRSYINSMFFSGGCILKLYELKEEFNGLLNLVDSGDLSESDIADTLECMEIDINEKIKGCLLVRQNLIVEQDVIQSEINRLDALLREKKNAVEGITNYVKYNLISMGMDKIDCGLFKVTIIKPTKKLGSIDENKIPAQYFEVIPETKKLNKRALLSDAKKFDIEGVELIDSERGITIK